MRYWLIRLDSMDNALGYLSFDENGIAVDILDADGNRLQGNIDYTTIDTSPATPSWAM